MRVGLCQMNITWEEKERNKIKAKKFIQEAAGQLVELILFSEMCLTGFAIDPKNTKEKELETIEFFGKCAKKYHIFIGFGWTKDYGSNNKAENHFSIVTPEGEVILDYTKIHPFSFAKEDKLFMSGQRIETCRIGEFPISTFICYDLRFPDVFQAVSDQVAIIIIPANWPEARRDQWRCLLKARAIENQVYILGINAVGKIGESNYAGDSCIIDPVGNVLTELSYEEGLLVYDIKNDVKDYREAFPVRKDRKVSLYRKWL
jgi:omega-amidase